MIRSLSLVLLFVFASASSHAIEVQVSNAPENNLSLTLKSISEAKRSILLNIYELSSPEIANALMSQIKAGIRVVILEEGSPVGGLSTIDKGIASSLSSAMNGQKQDHFFQINQGSATRRYHYDHAKYAVIDDEWLLIGSENYSPTGNPSPGSLGNRGWEVLIHDAGIAQNYRAVFMTDASLQFGDVTELSTHQASPALESMTQIETTKSKAPLGLTATEITRITSPDSSLSGLLGLIQNAKNSIDIEQMTFDSDWNKTKGASPLTAAVIAAAKRGVSVRVLLNDSRTFDHPGHPALPHNSDTVALLRNAGIDARIANIQAMGVDYIHNKGMLVDGNLTLVSSINWDQNSIEKNREAAVVITSVPVNQYFKALFDHDWQVSPSASLEKLIFKFEGADFCPHSIHFRAQIGDLTHLDNQDEDFKSLSNKTIEDEFVRDDKIKDCVLVRVADDLRIENRNLIEFRKRRDGTLSLNFEGYTPKNHKIYSIRETFKTLDPSGSSTAVLYDGSASREVLAKVNLEVKLN